MSAIQDDLWSAPRPVEDSAPPGRWDAPSAEAAERMIGRRAYQHVRILEWLLVNQPATDEAMGEGASVGPNSIRARRGELVELGMIVKVDCEGRTRAGNKATRWAVNEDATWEPVA